MKEFGLFIDGEWQAAKGGKNAPTINPATEEPWATVAVADREDVKKAVAAAKKAHDSGVWRNKSPQERGEILQRVAMAIFERQDEVAAAEVQDGGGTLRKAMSMDVPGAAQTFMHFGQFICGDEYKAMLQEEYDEDWDYYIDRATLEVLADNNIDPELLAMLEKAIGDDESMDIAWE